MATPAVTDDLVLKAHTGPGGRVWVLDGDRFPADSGLTPAAFAAELAAAAGRGRVRVLALPANVELAALLDRAAAAGGFGLEVASPLAVRSAGRRAAPETVLLDMRRWAARPSVGGWRPFGPAERAAFGVELAVRRRAPAGELAEVLAAHPAWPALARVPHLSPAAAAAVLGLVLDPRHFIDPDQPDRLGKLEAFLGLDPKVAAAAGRSGAANPQYARYRVLLEAWKRDDPGPRRAGRDPALFVWRAYYEAGGGPKGDLRAGRRLVHYLRHTWLDALYPGRAEPLFVPGMFFDAAGAAWYRAVR